MKMENMGYLIDQVEQSIHKYVKLGLTIMIFYSDYTNQNFAKKESEIGILFPMIVYLCTKR